MSMVGWLGSYNETSDVTIAVSTNSSIHTCIISTQQASTFHHRIAETEQDFSSNLILQPTYF